MGRPAAAAMRKLASAAGPMGTPLIPTARIVGVVGVNGDVGNAVGESVAVLVAVVVAVDAAAAFSVLLRFQQSGKAQRPLGTCSLRLN